MRERTAPRAETSSIGTMDNSNCSTSGSPSMSSISRFHLHGAPTLSLCLVLHPGLPYPDVAYNNHRFDAFTHKPTSQYSLAFEKASIIFNISAVLSCHAANQSRSEETGLKTAYHSFQASAGMFTYINENFLHAPSVDLSRDTVKTLISIMLAQAQEVFLEKQIADQKKVALLAKLASQAGTLYSQSVDGVQENVNKAIFEKVWLLMVQV